MSTLDLDKVSPATAAALQLGDSGDTVTVPSGVTLTATDATVSLPATITASTEIKTNKISPGSGTAFTFGDSGDTFNIPSGATITNSGTASGFGDCVLLSTQTASNSASISFTSGIDSTYKEYVFVFVNIHPATDDVHLQFQCSSDGGSSYGMTKTTTYFYAYNEEAGGASSGVSYQTSRDLAQSTSAQQIASLIGNDADASASGEFHLFNPASTTYVKNFYGTSNSYETSTPYTINNFVGGYVNSTSAINAIQFTMSSGNMDAGTIKMYGYT